MEYPYTILLFCLAGLLLLYAGIVALTKSSLLIPRDFAAKIDDRKKYVSRFARVLALVALSPALAGLSGLFFSGVVPVIVFLVSFVLLMRRGIRWMDEFYTEEP